MNKSFIYTTRILQNYYLNGCYIMETLSVMAPRSWIILFGFIREQPYHVNRTLFSHNIPTVCCIACLYALQQLYLHVHVCRAVLAMSEMSVCLSVCLSVRLSNAWIVTKRKKLAFIPQERSMHLLLRHEECLMGNVPFYLQFGTKLTHPLMWAIIPGSGAHSHPKERKTHLLQIDIRP